MKKNILKTALLFFTILISILFCPNCINKANAQDLSNSNLLNIEAKAYYLIDATSGTCILGNNQTQKLPIASMTKLATLAVVFEEINKGSLSLQELITVSQNAADTEGSSAFLDAGSKYSVEGLIKTIVVVSANDSCVALAEHISGSENLFANKMNELVKTLNLQNTHFANSTGLPSSNHYSCACDMAKIYQTVCNNSIYQKFSKIWMEDFVHPSGRITGLVNTNRLIKTYDGCTGGKTGHTQEAKYCLTASATRNGTTLISVIIGSPDSKTRFEQTKDLFNYGFANYTSSLVVDKNCPLAQIEVVGASTNNIQVFAKEDFYAFSKKTDEVSYKTHLMVDKKLSAPLLSGDSVGKVLVLDQNNIVLAEIDLIVKNNVDKKQYKQILEDIFKMW